MLHDIGERGANVSKVFAHGPTELTNDGHEFPFIIFAPQCPGGELLNIRFANPGKAKALKKLEFWAFCGARNNMVPVTESELKLTIYPNAKHDCWTKTLDNPKIYDWRLQHKRTNGWAGTRLVPD